MSTENGATPKSSEMRIGGEYQVLKRTVLLYSAGVIVTFLLHANAGAVSIFGFQVHAQSLVLMRLLLWLTGTYYALGYLLAFLAVRRANNEAIEEGYAAQQMFKRAEAKLWELNGDLDRIAKQWAVGPNLLELSSLRDIYGQVLQRPRLSEGIAQILQSRSVSVQSQTIDTVDRIVHEVRQVLQVSSAEAGPLAEQVAAILHQPLSETISQRLDQLDRQLNELDHTVPIWREIRKRVADDLPRFPRELQALAARFAWEERFTLYGWDLVAVVLMYIASTFGVFAPKATSAMLACLASYLS